MREVSRAKWYGSTSGIAAGNSTCRGVAGRPRLEHIYSRTRRASFRANPWSGREANWAGQMAIKAPVAADLSCRCPIAAARRRGFCHEESGTPLKKASSPTDSSASTSIAEQGSRAVAVLKLNIIPDEWSAGKADHDCEDSVVRRHHHALGNAGLFRRAGAREIHLRVSCPPIRHPCFLRDQFSTSRS